MVACGRLLYGSGSYLRQAPHFIQRRVSPISGPLISAVVRCPFTSPLATAHVHPCDVSTPQRRSTVTPTPPRRGALAIKERTDQARKLDAGLFRGTALAPMETALGGLGVEAIVVGGCCELNTTAHGLIVDIGTQLGIRAATASGEDVNQCVALETTRVRQRIAIFEIWSNYQDYICARLKFADPTPDKQRANEDEAVTNAAEQELHAQRYAIQAYLHRTHQPLELGV